jgi:hypothetical protein
VFEYSLCGESRFIRENFECEYDGRACDGRGLHNAWSQSIRGSEEAIVLVQSDRLHSLELSLPGCQALQEFRYQGEIGEIVQIKTVTNYGGWSGRGIETRSTDAEMLSELFSFEVHELSVDGHAFHFSPESEEIRRVLPSDREYAYNCPPPNKALQQTRP